MIAYALCHRLARRSPTRICACGCSCGGDILNAVHQVRTIALDDFGVKSTKRFCSILNIPLRSCCPFCSTSTQSTPSTCSRIPLPCICGQVFFVLLTFEFFSACDEFSRAAKGRCGP